MIFRIEMSTPQLRLSQSKRLGVQNAVEKYCEGYFGADDPEEAYTDMVREVMQTCARWFTSDDYGDHVTLEIDTVAGTCKAVKHVTGTT